MMPDPECRVAIEAVTRAIGLCETVRKSFGSEPAAIKADASPVTLADFGAQALILDMLQQAFPDDPVVAEEDSALLRGASGARLRDPVLSLLRDAGCDQDAGTLVETLDRGRDASGGPMGRFWTLDPIDGTQGFIRGDQYAVALALIADGRVRLGVLGCPRLRLQQAPDATGWILYAVESGGAWGRTLIKTTPVRPFRVSGRMNISQAIFCESVESAHTAQDRSARIARYLGVNTEPLRLDSQCKYAVVAAGDADVYLRLPAKKDYEEKIWDHAAGALLVTEAGGHVCDLDGQPLDFTQGRTLKRNRGVLATHAVFHNALMEGIQVTSVSARPGSSG